MIIANALIGGIKSHLLISGSSNQFTSCVEKKCKPKKEITEVEKLNIRTNPTIFTASFFDAAIRILLSYRAEPTTAKILVIDVKVASNPKSEGTKSLPNMG